MTQLTLVLDDELIHHAEAYAARTGKSLTDLVTGYIANLASKAPRPKSEPSAAESLPERQYRLASQYPGEYVVLVGERVVHHSVDRSEAGSAYAQACRDHPSSTPVMVDPNRPRQPRPIVRGRMLKRAELFDAGARRF